MDEQKNTSFRNFEGEFTAEEDTYIKAYTAKKALKNNPGPMNIQVIGYDDEKAIVISNVHRIFREVLGPLKEHITFSFEWKERKPSGIVSVMDTSHGKVERKWIKT